MTAKERAQFERLKAENARLREQLDKSLRIYSEHAWELIDLRTRLDLVRQAMEDEGGAA